MDRTKKEGCRCTLWRVWLLEQDTPRRYSWRGSVMSWTFLTTNEIGFALWEFKGSFGLIDSGEKMLTTRTGMDIN